MVASATNCCVFYLDIQTGLHYHMNALTQA
jgi:hypothetical protein